MPAPSLLSLVFPATSISPRGSPTKAKTQSHSHSHFLPFHKALASPLLHASSSSSSAAGDELHLLDKPSPSPAAEAAPPPSPDEALAPFLKFFRAKGTDPDAAASGSFAEDAGEGAAAARACAAAGGRGVRWYDPKPGDLVAGVVVGCDGRTLDVDVGAGGEPALMLTKEAVPLCGEEFGYLACDVASKDAGRFAVEGKVGIVVRCGEGEVVGGSKEKGKGAPVVGIGTVVFAEVLGRTLGGRPLLSARRLFRRVAWHRVRQVLYGSLLSIVVRVW